MEFGDASGSGEQFDILTIVGNRPQFIKMAPISAELARRGYREFIVHTGQHFDDNMSEVFFREFGIPEPHVHFHPERRTHGGLTAELLIEIEELLLKLQPKHVLIYGDTNSTLAAALAAVKLQIPMAHVEAGPRIYDIDTPEEINRIVADHASRLRFCPDIASVANLAKENVTDGVHFTGDVMYDAFLQCTEIVRDRPSLAGDVSKCESGYALLTVHRPNNTDTPDALSRLVNLIEKSPLPVVFPVHPRTKAALQRHSLWERLEANDHLMLLPAVGYLDMVKLVNEAEVVLTDSGGLQKEAVYAGKPCVILFYASPWPQFQAAGCLQLCWKDDGIDIERALDCISTFRPAPAPKEICGDGQASRRIVDILESNQWLTRAA